MDISAVGVVARRLVGSAYLLFLSENPRNCHPTSSSLCPLIFRGLSRAPHVSGAIPNERNCSFRPPPHKLLNGYNCAAVTDQPTIRKPKTPRIRRHRNSSLPILTMLHDEIQRYADQHTSPEPPLLAQLNRETHVELLHARMLSGHAQGRLLSMISHMMRPRRVLELGTFTGYAALCLAEGLAPDGELHTIECNPELEGRIRRYLAAAGLAERLQLHIGAATAVLPKLAGPWDLVFIDADKINNDIYYELVLPQVRPGGFVLIDNVLWGGKVLASYSAKLSDKDTHAVRAFNDKMQADPRVENVLLPLRDGLLLVRKL